jgi:hypothetical protein
MEDRLKNALEFANYRQTLNNQLHKIKLRTEGNLVISKNGGTFRVDQEFICFLDFLNRSSMSEATILDSNMIPVQITDVSAFLKEVSTRYFEVTNDYYRDFQSIRKARNVRTMLDLKDAE